MNQAEAPEGCRRVRVTGVLVLVLTSWSTSTAAQERQNLRLDISLAIAAQAADWTTTALALRDPDLRERNPILSRCNLWQIAAVKAGVTALATWGARSARDRGHPRVARGLLWLTAGVGGVAAGWNVRTMWESR